MFLSMYVCAYVCMYMCYSDVAKGTDGHVLSQGE